ncbi:MAG: class I SAM-dependent methyltransferase [Syntrophales bacterium]|nr:class I SAM-dependent methyltransferase [Syntrophales bacterium]
MNLFDYWGIFANIYDEGADYVVGKELRLSIYQRLSQRRELGVVLDLGCGTGYYTSAIVNNSEFVVASDLSFPMLQVARKRFNEGEGIFFCILNASRTPFKDSQFDTVIAANLLNTVQNPIEVLNECYRILRPGGWFIVIVYTDFGMVLSARVETALRYMNVFGLPPPWGLRNFKPEVLEGMVKASGFLVDDLVLLGKGPFGIFVEARKHV